MHTTAISTQPQSATVARTRPVWMASAGATAVAVGVTELYAAAARLAGVPMSAAGFGQAKAQPVTPGLIALGIIVCAFWGTLLAIAFARYLARPARAWLCTTSTLAAASLTVPLSAAHTATSTKLTLAGAHVLTAAIIIPLVTRRLRPGRPRASRG